MNYYLIKYKTNYFSMIPRDSTTKIICFKERHLAVKFKSYILRYKYDYGTWPNLDMNHDNEMIKYQPGQNIMTLGSQVKIEEREFDDISKDMQRGNIGILLCYKFNVLYDPFYKNKVTINLTGQELDEFK